MSMEFELYTNEQILEMEDEDLLNEIKKMKKVIYRIRKQGADTREAEEEISYLQAEAQNRGFRA